MCQQARRTAATIWGCPSQTSCTSVYTVKSTELIYTYIAGWQRGTLICYLWFDIQVSRAFIAARALSQGLATGRDIVNKATKVSGSYSASLHAYLEWNI